MNACTRQEQVLARNRLLSYITVRSIVTVSNYSTRRLVKLVARALYDKEGGEDKEKEAKEKLSSSKKKEKPTVDNKGLGVVVLDALTRSVVGTRKGTE